MQPQVFAPAFGVLMVGTATVGAHGPAIVVAIAAVVAVAAATVFRSAATLAVLLTVLALLAADPAEVPAALSGLCAVGYLVCRHAPGGPAGVVVASWPTIVSALGFSFAGLVAVSFPVQLPWLPLVAPLAVLAIYVVATRPFAG